VKYWDSSALMPLCVDEVSSPRLIELYRADPAVITWWGSEIECVSAFARMEREGSMTSIMVAGAMDRLKALKNAWHEVQPSQALRDTTVRLLRVHPLRVADAVQLSSAVIASDHEPSAIELVTLDGRLASAAQREGFAVISADAD
jgi:predicted nucleic acid-binding protein